ncbi:MAG TPA: FAD-binding oxidoreductase [Candidatus Limnocylindria bacterium]|nr:FAD-binding oxidoreductase [Candidatus Limnocylindria bacterium]
MNARLPPDAIDDLRRSIKGAVAAPGDPRYEDSRRTFNALVDRRPAVVVRPEDTDDVRTAFAFARSQGLPVSVRGGGHSVAGHGVGQDALALDLRPMSTVHVDPESRTVRVGGGATWRDVDPACQLYGLALPGGTFDATGVGGLTLGGGLGYLLGTYGLTIDNLVEAEVVTPAGDVLVASATAEPELFWALRGGGGNFGVVTAFVYRLHQVTTIFGGVQLYTLSDAPELIRRCRDLMAVAPDELTCMIDLDARGARLYVCSQQPPRDARSLLSRHLGALRAVRDGVRTMPYLTLQRATGELRFGLRHYWKGHFVTELTDELIDDAVAHVREPGAADSSILFEPLHGAASRVREDATAFGHRAARYNVSALGIWGDPALDAQVIAWARTFAAAIEPLSVSGGGYLNYGAPDEPAARVAAAYGAQNFVRLRAAKDRYDPGNVLRFNHNIPPGERGSAGKRAT